MTCRVPNGNSRPSFFFQLVDLRPVRLAFGGFHGLSTSAFMAFVTACALLYILALAASTPSMITSSSPLSFIGVSSLSRTVCSVDSMKYRQIGDAVFSAVDGCLSETFAPGAGFHRSPRV
jgi:hypothetical protein